MPGRARTPDDARRGPVGTALPLPGGMSGGFSVRRRAVRGMRAAAVSVLVTGVVLGSGACSPTPAATPTSSASASPTVEPTPTPTPTPTTTPEPERPDAMDEVGVDGAVAAATYFLSLYPYVYNTGDLTQWKAMSHPECIFCASVVTGVEEMHAKGNHQEGAATEVVSSTGVEVDPGSFYTVDLRVNQGPARELDQFGTAVDEATDTIASRMQFAVARQDDAWVIREAQVDVVAY